MHKSSTNNQSLSFYKLYHFWVSLGKHGSKRAEACKSKRPLQQKQSLHACKDQDKIGLTFQMKIGHQLLAMPSIMAFSNSEMEHCGIYWQNWQVMLLYTTMNLSFTILYCPLGRTNWSLFLLFWLLFFGEERLEYKSPTACLNLFSLGAYCRSNISTTVHGHRKTCIQESNERRNLS